MESRYSYEKHKFDPYYGKSLFSVMELSGGSFRVKEYFLVRNAEGRLGFVGEGVTWFLNYVIGDGACCFNPVDPERLLWSSWHNAYIFKSELNHFMFPVILGKCYTLEKDVKRHCGYNSSIIPKFIDPIFPKVYCIS